MGRPRSGTAYDRGDGVIVLAIRRRPPLKRWIKRCPPGPDGKPADLEAARASARELQRLYDAGRWDPDVDPHYIAPEPGPPERETFALYAGRWVAARVARGLRSADNDGKLLRRHVTPRLGAVALADVTAAQIEDLRDHLDGQVREDEMAWKSAQNLWSLVTKLFKDACTAKDRALRVRTSNPCTDVAAPDRGRHKLKQYLYPSESQALLACEAVPVHLRRIFALATYQYLRVGELAALQCEDVDLEHGTLRVYRSQSGKTLAFHEPKTAAGNRYVPLEPAVRPLVCALLREQGNQRGALIPGVYDYTDLAIEVRVALERAGVARRELFVTDRARKRMTFHDLRATGITWCAVRGDDAVKLQRRAGHEDFKTTLAYIREAENLRAGFGVVFPPLPAALLGLAQDSATETPASNGAAEHFAAENPGRAEIVRPAVGKDLNPVPCLAVSLSVENCSTGTMHSATLRGQPATGLAQALDGPVERWSAEAAALVQREAPLYDLADRALLAELDAEEQAARVTAVGGEA